MDPETQRRIAINEDRYRRANEHMTEAQRSFRVAGEASDLAIMCECADEGCTDMIGLDVADYEHVRSRSTWFAVRPGHVVGAVEQLVERHEAHWIIEKLGEGAREAARRS